eukprot:757042-Hanusia_phi.AAC.2
MANTDRTEDLGGRSRGVLDVVARDRSCLVYVRFCADCKLAGIRAVMVYSAGLGLVLACCVSGAVATDLGFCSSMRLRQLEARRDVGISTRRTSHASISCGRLRSPRLKMNSRDVDEFGDITKFLKSPRQGQVMTMTTTTTEMMMMMMTVVVVVVELADRAEVLMGSGFGFSEVLSEAVELALQDATKTWRKNSEGLPAVPSLALIFFTSDYARDGLIALFCCLSSPLNETRLCLLQGRESSALCAEEFRNVVGGTVTGFEGQSGKAGVSITLIQVRVNDCDYLFSHPQDVGQGDNLRVVPFNVGNEASQWTSAGENSFLPKLASSSVCQSGRPSFTPSLGLKLSGQNGHSRVV